MSRKTRLSVQRYLRTPKEMWKFPRLDLISLEEFSDAEIAWFRSPVLS